MSKTLNNQTVEWRALPWRELEVRVFKLQKRIFKASSRGDVKAVRRLQKTLMRSWSGKCLAVRKVTQDNQGKKTAGVDGVKSLSPQSRLALVTQLKVTGKSKPTRRVWIDKPGKVEKRPLGIPTMFDRAFLVRYADDFVILHESEEFVKFLGQKASEWLEGMGLELKPSKTRMCHTSEGFDFLGFNIRQYPVGAYRASKSSKGKPLGFKTLIKPTKE
jgi:retron-type reverse transcriptase